MRKFILAALLLGSTLMVNAQSGTNSPYSQYGLGVLSEQTSGFNRGMNGVGLGFHEHNQINYLNPASYAAIDSMTFILDAGISGQVTNFNENGVKKFRYYPFHQRGIQLFYQRMGEQERQGCYLHQLLRG